MIQQGEQNKQQTKKKEKSYKKINVDFNAPVSNNLVSLETALAYLQNNIKINGIKKKLGESVKVTGGNEKGGAKNTIQVQADNKMKFSKRYVKYLVKKFLKRENISGYLRVIANGYQSYVVKLFNRNTE